MARGNRESCEREVGRQKPESGALLADQLESHVHDQLAIVLVDAAEQRPQAVEETRVFTLAAPVVALQLNPLGEGRRFGRRFAVVEQLVERNFESSSQLFERLDGGNSVAVFHARNVAALQPSALFDVALREVFLFPYSAQAIGDNHDVPTYSTTCISLQTNLIVTGRIWLAPKKGQTGWPKKGPSAKANSKGGRPFRQGQRLRSTVLRINNPALQRTDPASSEIWESLEFAAGGGLLKADAPGGDFGFEIVFALHRGAREAAKHGDLADVRERVGDGGLQKSFRGRMQRLGGSEVVIEFFHGRKKAIDFGAPRQRCGVVPGLLALGHGKRPIKQIAHVREDLCRRARLVSDVKTCKVFRRAA